MRDLSHERIKYMYVDGVIFRMRVGGTVENVLVAIGVTEEGTKLVLGLQSGDKEPAAAWREFCRELKLRGLEGTAVPGPHGEECARQGAPGPEARGGR